MRALRVCVSLAVLVDVGVAAGAPLPIAVSPGDATGRAAISDPCPTFSWGGVEGASSYELVVYRIRIEDEEAEPVLRRSFAASVDSWTPSLDSCLERGGRYAWSVRAVGAADSDWSTLSLFDVASSPTPQEFELALETVRRYLAAGTAGNVGLPTPISFEPTAGTSPRGASLGAGPNAAPFAPATGDSALQVNGSPVVTVATLAGALCSTTEVRFLDLGDGTVLDCNTGKMWLKDASCLATGSWDNSGTSVFSKVADLNNTGVGSSFGCTDYVEGTYTDWQVPQEADMCGLWNGSCSGTACCTASAGLVDTSVGLNPTVGNAAGDGQWLSEDAFVGVVSTPFGYWSANQFDGSSAWAVSTANGGVGFVSKSTNANVWPVRGGS